MHKFTILISFDIRGLLNESKIAVLGEVFDTSFEADVELCECSAVLDGNVAQGFTSVEKLYWHSLQNSFLVLLHC